MGTTRFDIPTINSAKSLKTLVGLLIKCRCSLLADDLNTAKRAGVTRPFGCYDSYDECYDAIQVYEGELRRYVYEAIDRLCDGQAERTLYADDKPYMVDVDLANGPDMTGAPDEWLALQRGWAVLRTIERGEV